MTTALEITTLLNAHRFSFVSEVALQDGIESLLHANGIEYTREFNLSSKDRIDFLCGDVGIEVKIDGSANMLARQVMRYLRFPELSSIVVVTSKASHVLPESLNDKPIHRVWLSGL